MYTLCIAKKGTNKASDFQSACDIKSWLKILYKQCLKIIFQP